MSVLMPAKPARSKAASPIYQLKITLKGYRPPIWRRVLVPGDYTLAKLHWVMQYAMGWTNSHLRHFRVGETYYSLPIPGADWEDAGEADARRVKLAQVAPRVKAKFEYEYDFGDSWEHDVVVEKILPPEPGVKYPVCLAGKGACPPEDVGGVWGYADFLEAIADPKHEEHDRYLEWIGGEFNPDAFDPDEVNRALRRIK
jgi:hypothetical protein